MLGQQIDKTELLRSIVAELQAVRDQAASAADAAKETATDSENIAENKYDTLGLEAAYLAHGQSNRILQLEEDIRAFEQMELVDSDKAVLGSLVKLEDDDGEQSLVFLGPSSGGLKISHCDVSIQIITPAAPLGKSLMGRQVDDEVLLEIGEQERCFLVAAIA